MIAHREGALFIAGDLLIIACPNYLSQVFFYLVPFLCIYNEGRGRYGSVGQRAIFKVLNMLLCARPSMTRGSIASAMHLGFGVSDITLRRMIMGKTEAPTTGDH